MLWRERLRFDYLQEKLEGEAHERIVEMLTYRAERLLKNMRELSREAVHQIYLTALAQVYDPHSNYLGREQMEMQQTAPGRFEAVIETPRRGAYHLDIAQQRADGRTQRSSRGITVGYPDELRLLPLGESTLRGIAKTSGGRYDPAPQSIAEPDDRTAREPKPLWPWLLMSALTLFVADVGLRRIELAH